MLAIVGTVPEQDFPLLAGKVELDGRYIRVGGREAAVKRGTPALIAAALRTAEFLNLEEPFAYLVGDIGRGEGSKKLYQYLEENIRQTSFRAIALHYIQPIVEWHNKVLEAILEMRPKPVLIADAGFMYVAKMSGRSSHYDLFTPDVGELAYLADDVAPHPFYARGFILHEQDRVPDMIAEAYAHNNAAAFLVVKGVKDYVADRGGIRHVIEDPVEEAMEAIGGTGDTLTGIAAALSASGMDTAQAALIAAKVNRVAGSYTRPTPATQVAEIIDRIPEALKACMPGNSRQG